MTEESFVDKHLSFFTTGWEDRIITGRADLAELDQGTLKAYLLAFKKLHAEITKQLEELSYEAG